MSDKTKGNIALLITAIAWGTGFIAQKLGNDAMPPLTFNTIRQLMGAIVLSPLMFASLKKSGYLSRKMNTDSQLAFKKKKALKAFFVCGLCLCSGTCLQQLGLLTVSAGKSGFISALYIVFTPVISIVVGKKVNSRAFACIAVAMVGFGFLSLKGGLGNTTQGDWLTLISAVAFAAHIVSVNVFIDRENGLLISVLQSSFCGTIGLIGAILVEHPSMESILSGMPILLYSTLVPTAIGYTLQVIGQKYTDSTTAALLMSLEAVFAVIFGAIFLHEHMLARELFGCLLIFIAVIVNQLPERSDRKK